MTVSATAIDAAYAVRILGIPVPQGSKVAFIDRATKSARLKDANEKTLKTWRKHVTNTARTAISPLDGVPFTGPVQVWVRFTFERPASHWRTGRNAHLLKDTAPIYPTYKLDVDKLQRAIFDALTDAGIWADDGLVVDVRARKFYAGEHELALDQAGVDIIIEPLAQPATAARF